MSDPVKIMIDVTQTIEVTLDRSKFDEAFMAEFRATQYDFTTIEQHAAHIAQLQARGLVDLEFGPTFIEGYGESGEMGIRARKIAQTEEESVPW